MRAGVSRVVAAVALAASAVAGCTSSTTGGHADTSSSAADGRCTQPDYERANLLSLQLTAALQHHSRPELLALASSPSARAAMSAWYDNVSGVGFTTAAAGPADSPDAPPEDVAPPTQTVTIDIGLHNAFDETLDAVTANETATPEAPATRYRLATKVVHDRGGDCHLSVTSWTSATHAPWDATSRLVVVKTPHVVVAGDPAATRDVRRVAPLAERAARFVSGFFRSVKRSGDIQLKGFVMFVPTSDAQANSWFTYSTRPSGWLKDVGNADGVEYPLDGAQLPASRPVGAPRVTDVAQIGGGRVIITRRGLRESPDEITATLVHEFTHDVYNNYSDGWFTGKPTDAALAEGAARYVETFYRLDPTNAKVVHSMDLLGPVIRQHFGLFRGRTPTASQIYGTASLADYYYDLSASCFSFLAAKYGITFAVQSIRNAYANGGGPFSGIITKISHGGDEITYGDEATYERAWATWLRGQV